VLVAGLIAGAVVVTGSACGSAAKTSSAVKAPVKAAAPKIVNITAIGKIDTDTGPAGSFTSKEHWPAMAPSDLKVTKGDTVVLTVKEYDDAPTALPAGSPYNKVAGGTMTVDGVAGTTVSNANIAHTFSIPELGVNVPLTKAPEGKTTTTVFTFKVTKSGTYTWHCFTPCGGEPGGMGGSMATNGWMQGNLVVA
jgi:FtsP/CotA-like multicopper oxidase with cupredoxin domain